MPNTESEVIKLVDYKRIKKIAFDSVRIPSPTGKERKFAEFYADTLEKIGLDVSLDYEYSESPSVIAKLVGNESRPIIEFNGHLDHIPVDHPPPRIDGETIYGRGIADMKSGLVAIAEAIRAIKESGCSLNGTVMLVANGLHEAPFGSNEPLQSLIKKGVHGDACVVCELANDFLPIVCKGMTVFKITFTQPGEILHETEAPGATNAILVGNEIIKLLEDSVAEVNLHNYKKIGSESVFFGIFKSGDFYNRIPNECYIEGTRRFLPGRLYESIEKEFEKIKGKIQNKYNAEVKIDLFKVGLPFKVDKSEKIVTSLCDAYRVTTGKKLKFGETSTIGNATYFVHIANIPSVYHGVDQSTAHSSLENVNINDIARAAKVYALTILNYLS
jgi:acetylornithine deacetylase/succinyl-diaminopimelate desuccinylase-like protein